jgi:hypothetical protein
MILFSVHSIIGMPDGFAIQVFARSGGAKRQLEYMQINLREAMLCAEVAERMAISVRRRCLA